MDDTIIVQDHTKLCEHGALWPHWSEVRKGKWWQNPDCPGGRTMVLQRQPDGSWREIEPPAGDR
jgi:hypothetical protein